MPQATPSRGMLRHQALALHVKQVRRRLAEHGTLPAVLGQPVDAAWLKQQLGRVPDDDAAAAVGTAALVAQACAVLTKADADIAALGSTGGPGGTDLHTLQAELMLDAAIGMALLRELRPAIDAAVKAGQMDQAKHLTQLEHRVRKTVSTARQSIAESERARVAALSDSLTDLPREEAAAPRKLEPTHDLTDDLERRRVARRRRIEAIKAWLPGRTESLVALLGCLLLGWGLTHLAALRVSPPPKLTAADFPARILLSVETRHPVVYVVFDSAQWELTTPGEREAIIANLSTIPLARDFTSAQFRTDTGRSVGVWWRDKGLRMARNLEHSAADSPPAESATAAFRLFP